MGYHRPARMEDAFAALAAGAAVVAGGTDWYPALGERPAPASLLDVSVLPGFRGVAREGAGWRIGAATTWAEIARAALPPAFDGLRAAAREVGSVQIQNAGTLGGNLCTASPAADGVPALLTLDAVVRLVCAAGSRDMALGAFLLGPRRTALRGGELLHSVHIPDPGDARGAFVKLGARKYLVISIAMAAALVRVEAGRIVFARVALGACSPVAQRLPALEAALAGAPAGEAAARVSPAHFAGLAPISDIRCDAAYRLEAAAELARRALRLATETTDG